MPGDGTLRNPYQHFKDELSVLDGVLLKGTKIVVPISMRKQMLKLVHEGHLGMEKCKRRAREVLYWPGMHRDIVTLVQNCEVCQRHRHQQPKEPMKPHDKPMEPWGKVGMDLFQLKDKDYLLLMDYHSNYPEFVLLSNTTTEQVIAQTKAIFARHGIPVTVISDNGPQFTSQSFKDFARNYGFEHITSSPLYPQSNGLAEKGVQIIKRLLKKAIETGEDPHLAVLNYRTSPLENGLSPAEMLMNRKLRTRLPSAKHHMVRSALHSSNERQMKYYNSAAKPLSPLAQEEVVRVRCDGQWGPLAKVIKETTPRSYEVLTEHGKIMRRNRRHLLKVPQREMKIKESDTHDLAISKQSEQAETPDESKVLGTDKEKDVETLTERPKRQINRPKRLIEEM